MQNIAGENNKVTVPSSANFSCELTIDGSNNIVEISDGVIGHLVINIAGTNNRVHIHDGVKFHGRTIIDLRSDSCHFLVGAGSTFQGSLFHIIEPGTGITIGRDCIFARDTLFLASDFHSIFDLDTGFRLNPAGIISIGDHVWIGLGVTVLKGVTIESNSVVGIKSIVTKDIPKNVIASGSPARVVKKNITWDKQLIKKLECPNVLDHTRTEDAKDMRIESRESQLSKDLARWPARARDLFLSADNESARVYGAYRQCVMRGEFDYLELFVDPGKVSIDVGANTGQYSLKLSAMSKACLSIEPLKALSFLERVLPDNCVFRNVAAGKSRGTSVLRIPRQNGVVQYGLSTMAPDNPLRGFDCEQQITEVRTVDDLVQETFPNEKIGYIKIDVEGLEDEVIEGSIETLKMHRPNLQIELHGNEGIESVCRLMSERGYRGVFFFKGRLFDASQFEPGVHRAPQNEWGQRTRAGLEFDFDLYVCDFFFIPATK